MTFRPSLGEYDHHQIVPADFFTFRSRNVTKVPLFIRNISFGIAVKVLTSRDSQVCGWCTDSKDEEETTLFYVGACS